MIITILNYFFKFQIFFRYYLSVIFFINLYIFYIFIIDKLINLKKNINNNGIEDGKNINNDGGIRDVDVDVDDNKYCQMFKKIKKITNNPIIFEYQITQSDKIDITSNKYIKYSKELDKINKHKYQYIKSHKYLKKIKKILLHKNKFNISDIDIIIKLMYINF